MGKNTENTFDAVNLIASSTNLVGNIATEADIRIDGSLQGDIETSGVIIIGVSGTVKGNVKCLKADIEGYFDGNIEIKELLTLKKTSKLNGDISTNTLQIEPGAQFTGTCKMV